MAALLDFAQFWLGLERASISVRGFRVSSAEQQIKTLACPRFEPVSLTCSRPPSTVGCLADRLAHRRDLSCCIAAVFRIRCCHAPVLIFIADETPYSIVFVDFLPFSQACPTKKPNNHDALVRAGLSRLLRIARVAGTRPSLMPPPPTTRQPWQTRWYSRKFH
jgi:hypothetical protein